MMRTVFKKKLLSKSDGVWAYGSVGKWFVRVAESDSGFLSDDDDDKIVQSIPMEL